MPHDSTAEAEKKATLALLERIHELADTDPMDNQALTLRAVDAIRLMKQLQRLPADGPWPPEAVRASEEALRTAGPGELVTAEHLHRAFHDAMPGSPHGVAPPDFSTASPPIRRCWVAVAQAALGLHGEPPPESAGARAYPAIRTRPA